jgi:FG-GAP repeat protein
MAYQGLSKPAIISAPRLHRLAIGLPDRAVNGNSGSGAVVIIFGSRNGLTTDTSVSDCTGKGHVPAPLYFDMTNAAHVPLSCATTLKDAHFGASLAWGDFNKDGIGDLVVGVSLLRQ